MRFFLCGSGCARFTTNSRKDDAYAQMDQDGRGNDHCGDNLLRRLRTGGALSVELVNARNFRIARDYVLAGDRTSQFDVASIRRVRLVGRASAGALPRRPYGTPPASHDPGTTGEILSHGAGEPGAASDSRRRSSGIERLKPTLTPRTSAATRQRRFPDVGQKYLP